MTVSDTDLTLASEVAGVVLALTAAPGARLAEGDEILLLESMKMEIPLLAPRAGALTLLVAEGEAVSEGQPLARLRP